MTYVWNKDDVEAMINFILCQPPKDEYRIMRILQELKDIKKNIIHMDRIVLD